MTTHFKPLHPLSQGRSDQPVSKHDDFPPYFSEENPRNHARSLREELLNRLVLA